MGLIGASVIAPLEPPYPSTDLRGAAPSTLRRYRFLGGVPPWGPLAAVGGYVISGGVMGLGDEEVGRGPLGRDIDCGVVPG